MPVGFAQSLGLGKWGERQVINHLRSREAIREVRDVSEDTSWQKKGVDLVIQGNGHDDYWTADVKLDRMIARTGNLFIETMSGEHVMGNLVTSEAHIFYYLDSGNCRLFTVDRKKMLDYWLENQETIPVKRVGNKDRLTQGFVISVNDALEKGLASVEDIFVEGARNNNI